jgi:hypothetical protein
MRIILLLLGCLLACTGKAQDLEHLKSAQPVTFRGALTTGFQVYKVYGINPRSANPQWNLYGNATLGLYGLDIPMSFTIGRQGNNVQYPTFKQFGASPRWRWITMHGGWRNLYFSPYTLAGHSFLGGGIELTPGKFRFGAMIGNFRQARTAKTTEFGSNYPATFKRSGYAFKIGVGSRRTYFDLIYLRAKDDLNSLPNMLKDSTLNASENAVWGYSTRFQMGKHLSFFSDGAVSMFTRNQNSNTVEVDSSLIPKIPSLIRVRFSTRLNYAAKAGLEFHFSKFNLKTAYERVAPNFETMGAYYFNNDIENITVSPNFGFAQNKGRFYGSLGIQRNNLLGNRSETTKRVIGNAAFSYNPNTRFGLDANYMNASVNQSAGNLRLNDTIRIAVLNTNIGLTPHWNWADSLRARGLVLSVNYQQLNDRNPFTREYADMNTAFATANWSKNYTRGAWGWSVGANFNNIKVYQLKNNRYGAQIGLNKSWSDGLGSAGLNLTWNRSDVGGKRDGALWSASLNTGWTFWELYNLSIFVNVLKNDSAAFEDYTEWQGGTTISRSFGNKKKKSKPASVK